MTLRIGRRALLLGAVVAVGACAQEPLPGEELPPAELQVAQPWPEAIVREVLAMEQADQRVRDTLTSLLQGADPDTAALRRAGEEQLQVDRANTERLKAIIAEYGWPAKADVGAEAATAAFTIVQHAAHDIAFQKEYLAFLEEEHRKGQAPGDAVAVLTDITRLAEGRPQLYGSQVEITDGRLVVPPVENEAELDRRRAALGLGPHAEYLQRIRQAYGIPR